MRLPDVEEEPATSGDLQAGPALVERLAFTWPPLTVRADGRSIDEATRMGSRMKTAVVTPLETNATSAQDSVLGALEKLANPENERGRSDARQGH